MPMSTHRQHSSAATFTVTMHGFTMVHTSCGCLLYTVCKKLMHIFTEAHVLPETHFMACVGIENLGYTYIHVQFLYISPMSPE